jgi:putative Holliday junction resolvase
VRYLAIDLGAKRTGLALGDDVTLFVAPLDVLEVPRHPDDARLLGAVCAAIEAQAPGAIVIGLPINMDDTEGPAAKSARAFGESLHQRTQLLVHFQDERLTSFAAERDLAGSGRTRQEKRALADALAAAHILRDFLAARQRAQK